LIFIPDKKKAGEKLIHCFGNYTALPVCAGFGAFATNWILGSIIILLLVAPLVVTPMLVFASVNWHIPWQQKKAIIIN
jgi:hypothetical protein